MMKNRKAAPKFTDGIPRVLAMKDGVEYPFSEEAWRIGKPERHGFVKIGVRTDAIEVETEEIRPSEIPDESVTVQVTTEEDDIYPTKEEIKTFLKDKGVKFHHQLGEAKLRALFDENKE